MTNNALRMITKENGRIRMIPKKAPKQTVYLLSIGYK